MGEGAVDTKYFHMTHDHVGLLVTKLAIPSIVCMLVTSLYNMADTFFVGKISTEATASVGVIFPLMSLIQAVGFFSGHGSGTYISQKLGSKDEMAAKTMAASGFIVSFCLGLLITLFGFVFSAQLVRLFGASNTIAKDTTQYMRTILVAAPFMTTSLTMNNQLRFQGNAFYSMVALIIGAVFNVALDPILIFVCHLGIFGAAIATAISQTASFVLLFIASNTGDSVGIHLSRAKFNRTIFFSIINGGTPSLFRQGLGSVAIIVLNNTAGAIGGEIAIAAMSVVNRYVMACNCALIGFGQGFQPVCAFNYGANCFERVKKAFWFCIKYGVIFLAMTSVLSYVFAPAIVRFFRDDAEVVAIGTPALRYQTFTFITAAFAVMSNMFLQSIGCGVKASIAAAARNGIFFIPFIFILTRTLGLFGLEITQACADLCSFFLATPMALCELKKLNIAK